jgi:hypothetical protein
LVEVLAFVVGQAAGEQSGVAPGLDGAGADVQVAGDLVEGQQSLVAQALGVAAQLVGLAALADEPGV